MAIKAPSNFSEMVKDHFNPDIEYGEYPDRKYTFVVAVSRLSVSTLFLFICDIL